MEREMYSLGVLSILQSRPIIRVSCVFNSTHTTSEQPLRKTVKKCAGVRFLYH